MNMQTWEQRSALEAYARHEIPEEQDEAPQYAYVGDDAIRMLRWALALSLSIWGVSVIVAALVWWLVA